MKHLIVALTSALTLVVPDSHAATANPTGAGGERVHVRVHCKTASDDCPPPPVPPAPPAAPAPPPAPGGAAAHAPALPAAPPMPVMPPVPPAPPSPPPAPPLPEVPAAAHAACASKPAGSTLAWSLDDGGTMRGVCRKRNGRMVFVLRSYQLHG